jgi:hypothetical protein
LKPSNKRLRKNTLGQFARRVHQLVRTIPERKVDLLPRKERDGPATREFLTGRGDHAVLTLHLRREPRRRILPGDHADVALRDRKGVAGQRVARRHRGDVLGVLEEFLDRPIPRRLRRHDRVLDVVLNPGHLQPPSMVNRHLVLNGHALHVHALDVLNQPAVRHRVRHRHRRIRNRQPSAK